MGRKRKALGAGVKNTLPITEPGKVVVNENPMQNGLMEVLGFGVTGFPQNQGAPGTEQVENVNTSFKNLRWYLVSNFWQFLSQSYVEWGLVQTIVDVPVDDALRGGIEIKSNQLNEEQIAELLVSVDRDEDLVTAGQTAKWTRLYGGGGVLILTDQDPMTPLDISTLDENSHLEFRAADMWELTWEYQNTNEFTPSTLSEDSEFYSYYGTKVHKSRVMKLIGIQAPSFIRPRLRGWGMSVVETLVREINQYLKATCLAFEVLDEFKVDVYKIKNLVNTLLSSQGAEAIRRRVQLANYQKNYQNALTMDSEDDWDHKQLSFAGLADMMKEIRMQIASAMRMPITKLFGISATGFNSGEDDIEVYNAMVESQVRNKIKYPILRMLEIKCQVLFGFVPDDLSIDFKPLRVMSSEQEESCKEKKFNRVMQARQAGEITAKEFRDACNKGDLFDITLDTSNSALEELDGMGDNAESDGEDVEDTDNPGTERASTTKPKASDKGGISKDPPKSKDIKTKTPEAKEQKAKTENAKWEESKHPRADDGKFGEGSGSGGSSAVEKKSKSMKPMKVTAEQKAAGIKWMLSLSSKRDTKVTNPVEHQIAERLVADGQAEIVGKKNYGRIEAIRLFPEKESTSASIGYSDNQVKSVIEKTKKTFDGIKSTKPKLYSAIMKWSTTGYLPVRDVQRGVDLKDPEEHKRGQEILKDLDENFSNLPSFDGPLVRDIQIDVSDALTQFKAGDEFVTDAYTSFTARDRYLTRRKVRIIVEKNSAGKSAWGLCQDPEEMEVIVPKGIKYKIDRVEEADEAPYVRVYVKEVA